MKTGRRSITTPTRSTTTNTLVASTVVPHVPTIEIVLAVLPAIVRLVPAPAPATIRTVAPERFSGSVELVDRVDGEATVTGPVTSVLAAGARKPWIT